MTSTERRAWVAGVIRQFLDQEEPTHPLRQNVIPFPQKPRPPAAELRDNLRQLAKDE